MDGICAYHNRTGWQGAWCGWARFVPSFMVPFAAATLLSESSDPDYGTTRNKCNLGIPIFRVTESLF